MITLGGSDVVFCCNVCFLGEIRSWLRWATAAGAIAARVVATATDTGCGRASADQKECRHTTICKPAEMKLLWGKPSFTNDVSGMHLSRFEYIAKKKIRNIGVQRFAHFSRYIEQELKPRLQDPAHKLKKLQNEKYLHRKISKTFETLW